MTDNGTFQREAEVQPAIGEQNVVIPLVSLSKYVVGC